MNNNFNKMNFKKVYQWPLLWQSVIGVIFGLSILAAGVFFIILEQNKTLNSEVKKEATLKEEYISKTKQSVNLSLYKQQLLEITKNSEELLRQLPNKSEVEKLLIDINQAGAGRGLKFELFKPNKEIISEYYAELPIDIQLRGTYSTLGGFIEDLSKLSRVVILKDIKLTKSEGDILLLTAQARTFRYLDQEELRQKAAQAKSQTGNNRNNRNNRRNTK